MNDSPLRLIVFFAIVVLLDGGMHLYFYRRLVHDVTESRRRRRLGAMIFLLLAVLMALGPATVRMEPGVIGTFVPRAGFVWMGIAFYLFVTLGTLDLLRLLSGAGRRVVKREATPQSPERRRFLRRSAGVGAAAITAPTVGYGLWRAWAPPEISEVSVKLPNLPRALSGLTIVQLTDIHVGPWIERGFVETLVARAQALKPDLFVITGDLVDGPVSRLATAVAPLGGLRSRFGTFFVNGNHEHYSGVDEWDQALGAMGLEVLRNQRTAIGDSAASLDLIGVEDWAAPRPGYDLQAALAGRDPERASVLLAHQPYGFEAAADLGVGLQLSGHTHGGQIFPWSVLVDVVYHPYGQGLHHHGSSSIYVSRGCGFWGPPLRVGAAPEIVRIALV